MPLQNLLGQESETSIFAFYLYTLEYTNSRERLFTPMVRSANSHWEVQDRNLARPLHAYAGHVSCYYLKGADPHHLAGVSCLLACIGFHDHLACVSLSCPNHHVCNNITPKSKPRTAISVRSCDPFNFKCGPILPH